MHFVKKKKIISLIHHLRPPDVHVDYSLDSALPLWHFMNNELFYLCNSAKGYFKCSLSVV